MDPNQIAALQSMIQSLATQIGSFTTSVADFGGKLDTVVNSLSKASSGIESVVKANKRLANEFDNSADAAARASESINKLKESAKNTEYLNNSIGGYGKAIQTAAERIDNVLKKADGFDIDGKQITSAFNAALNRSMGSMANAQLESVAKIKQVQVALGNLGQVINLTKDQQKELNWTEFVSGLNSLDKETKKIVSKLSGIDLSKAGNFTKTQLTKSIGNLTDEQKRSVADNIKNVTKTFAAGVTPKANFKEKLFESVAGSLGPVAEAGAAGGIKNAFSHPTVIASGAQAVGKMINDISNVVIKGMGTAIVDTATAYGKYNIEADYQSSVALRVSMGTLQQTMFDNARAMLANTGGAQAFAQQLKDITSNELIRKSGYDTAKALQISASAITTARAVIGRDISDISAGDQAKSLINFFQQAAKAGHTTVEEYANLASALSENATVMSALSKLNSTSRIEALKDIIATRDHADVMVLGKEKALEFATALVGTRQDKLATRAKAAAATVSLVSLAQRMGYSGMSSAEAIKLAELETKGATRTAEENKLFKELLPKAGNALAFLERSMEGSGDQGLAIESAVDRIREYMGPASNYMQSIELAAQAANKIGLRAQAPTPGEADSIVGAAATAAGDLWKVIETTLDGVITKGLTAAIFGSIGATVASTAATMLLIGALKLNTAATLGKSTIGGAMPGGLGGKIVSSARMLGSLAGGAAVGYGVSKLLEDKEATPTQQIGGAVGGLVGGAAGGAVIGRLLGGAAGTLLGGPVGTMIGMGLGSVLGHYIGTAAGTVIPKLIGSTNNNLSTTIDGTVIPKLIGSTNNPMPNVDAIVRPNGSSPSQSTTQPIRRQEEATETQLVDKINDIKLTTAEEGTEVLRNLLKAQQTQNSLMSEYIDIYKQTNEPPSLFSFTPRPEKEPHKQR